jgi:glycerophosphoryl diester phosphodiesterase
VSRLGRGGLLPRAAAVVGGLVTPRLPRADASSPCQVIGHRGAARLEAENTIRAFERALELGADTVETDISVTSDGRFALWHDADPNDRVALARQVGAEKLAYQPRAPELGSPWRRPVRELTSDELERHYGYEARDSGRGSHAPGVGIDWLEDLISWAGRVALTDVYLDVKLADDQTHAVASLIEKLRGEGRRRAPNLTYHLLSPRENVVRALVAACRNAGSAAANLRVSADLELPSPDPHELSLLGAGDVSLGLGGRLWWGYRHDVGRMLRARDDGLFGAVVAWTLNRPRRLEALVGAGVDGILTDEPALLRKLVAAAGREARRDGGNRAPRARLVRMPDVRGAQRS